MMYWIETLENWMYVVSYAVEARSPEEAEQRVRSGNVPFAHAELVTGREPTEVIEVISTLKELEDTKDE